METRGYFRARSSVSAGLHPRDDGDFEGAPLPKEKPYYQQAQGRLKHVVRRSGNAAGSGGKESGLSWQSFLAVPLFQRAVREAPE